MKTLEPLIPENQANFFKPTPTPPYNKKPAFQKSANEQQAKVNPWYLAPNLLGLLEHEFISLPPMIVTQLQYKNYQVLVDPCVNHDPKISIKEMAAAIACVLYAYCYHGEPNTVTAYANLMIEKLNADKKINEPIFQDAVKAYKYICIAARIHPNADWSEQLEQIKTIANLDDQDIAEINKTVQFHVETFKLSPPTPR